MGHPHPAVEQHLLLRGSRDFASLAAYITWLHNCRLTLALPKEACAALRAYLAVRPAAPDNDSLFLSRRWQALRARDVQRLLTATAQRPGLTQKVTPHMLRHTYASRFLQAGGDIATLAQLLGHSSVATTTWYLHPDAGWVQEMVEEL